MSDDFYRVGDIIETLGDQCEVFERVSFDTHDYLGVKNLKTGEAMYLMEAKTHFGKKYFYETNAFFEKRLSYGLRRYRTIDPEFVQETKKFLVIGKTKYKRGENYIFCVEYTLAKSIATDQKSEEYYGIPVHIFLNDVVLKEYDKGPFRYRTKLLRFAFSLKDPVPRRIKQAYEESKKFTE